MVTARTQALRHLLLRRVALSANPTPHLETARSPLSSPSLAALSPSPLPLLQQPPESHRARRCRPPDHRTSLALSLCQEAPPLRPRRPHRTTRRQKPCNGLTNLVFNLGHPSSSSSIRAVKDVPEPTDLLRRLPVSSCSQPLSPRRRIPPLSPLATAAEAHRRHACRRRRCRSPNSRPSTTSSSWISQEPAQPLSSLARQA